MRITILTGTARAGNDSSRVTTTLAAAFTAAGHTVTTVSPEAYLNVAQTVPPWEAGAPERFAAWRDAVVSADRLVFVLPEYNRGYPGEWKLLIDTLYEEYAGKRVALVGVSSGTFAGARVLEHVLPILVELKFVLIPQRLHFGKVASLFNAAGELTDAATHERVSKFVAAVVE